jgi:hypothetical protein
VYGHKALRDCVIAETSNAFRFNGNEFSVAMLNLITGSDPSEAPVAERPVVLPPFEASREPVFGPPTSATAAARAFSASAVSRRFLSAARVTHS